MTVQIQALLNPHPSPGLNTSCSMNVSHVSEKHKVLMFLRLLWHSTVVGCAIKCLPSTARPNAAESFKSTLYLNISQREELDSCSAK